MTKTKTSLPTLYKRTELGQIQVWTMHVDGNKFYSIEGIQGGTMTTNKPTVCAGKNVGRANETSPEEQATKEAQAKWKKKTESGYSTDVGKVDDAMAYFEPQLAHKYNDYKDRVKFPVLVSKKLDGLRMIITKQGIFTRNGKIFNATPHLRKVLEPIFVEHPNWVLDGEGYTSDVPFEKVVSLIKRQKPTAEDLAESAKLVQFWLFDGVVDAKNASFDKRFGIITEAISKLSAEARKMIVVVDNIEVTTHEEIIKYHDKFVGQGFEGIMIRVPSAPYENKRSRNLLKYKQFIDDEFEIIDVVEGQGNRSGMAGQLTLKMKDGKTFGAGIKGGEDFYKELWKDRVTYTGKKATVRYQNLTEAGVPRFPVAVVVDPIDR